MSTLSPGFRNSPVVAPTPETVPVLMMSPGSNVLIAFFYKDTATTENSIWLV